ncbi:MAG: hypothetical protein OXF42_06670, partial [Candidatus Dadabacteria bacterium]|nr:hypothetical protein [Candidatus Dadabacteria bacterium]
MRSFSRFVLLALIGLAAAFSLGAEAQAQTGGPSLVISFVPNPVQAGSSTTVTYTLTNPTAGGMDYTGIGFRHSLARGFGGLIPGASVSHVSSGCDGATNEGTASYSGRPRSFSDRNGGYLNVSGVGLNAGVSCTITLRFTPPTTTPVGTYYNDIAAVNANEGEFVGMTRATLEVTDRDTRAMLSVSLDAVNVPEGNDIVFNVKLSEGVTDQVTVGYEIVAGTAFSDDYTVVGGATGTLSFPSGVSTRTIRVMTVDDSIVESSENLRLNLGNLMGANVVFAPGAESAFAYILDNDVPTIMVSDVAVSEGDRAFDFVVGLNPTALVPVTVGYSVLDGTATSFADYTVSDSLTGVLTFDPGEFLKRISVEVIDDTVDEATETLGLRLENISGGAIFNGAYNQLSATATITDDDDPGVSFVDDMVTVGEEDETLTFRLRLKTALDATAMVSYAFGGRTANYGNDYTFAGTQSGTLTFVAGEREKPVVVTITDDDTDEANETLTLTLNNPVGLTLSGGATEIVATGTIEDNDGPEILVSGISVGEGDGTDATAAFTVGLSAASPQRITVNYFFDNGTATGGADYRVDNAVGVLTFEANDTEQTLQFTIVHDEEYELSETIALQLSGAVNAMFPGGSASRNVFATIEDNDGPTLSFINNHGATVAEDVGTLMFTVAIDDAPLVDASVRYTTGGSMTGGQDYTVSDRFLDFRAGSMASQIISVVIRDDLIDEDEETLTVTLSPLSSALRAGLKIPSPSVAVTITDNDVPVLTISGPTSVTEGTDAAAEFTITANPAPKEDLTVILDVAEATGGGEGDFITMANEGQKVLTFAAGAASATYPVSIEDDGGNEADGSVTATLSRTGIQGYTVGTPGNVTVALLDDDIPVLSIMRAGVATIGEDMDAVFTVTANPAPRSNEIEVVLNVADVEGGDFVDMDGDRTVTLTFNGETTAAYTLDINDDVVDEVDGTLTVTLMEDSSRSYTVGTPAGATITVTDNEIPDLIISAPTGGSVMEGENAVFTITASPAPAEDLVVGVNIIQTGDFLASGQEGFREQTLTFIGGSATYTIFIGDDSIDEENGSMVVTFSKAGSPDYTIAGGTQQFITVAFIDDDTPDLTISGPASVTEGENAVFTITANPVPKEDLFVELFVSQTGNFLAPGQTSFQYTNLNFSGTTATYTVLIDDDNINEDDGSVTVALSAPRTGGRDYSVVGGTQTATVAIRDDDNNQLTITADASPVDEGETAVFTIRASYLPASPLEVRLVVLGEGNFIDINDRGVKTLALPFTPVPGEMAATATYTIDTVDDNNDEYDGTLTVRLLSPETEQGYGIGPVASAAVSVEDNDIPNLTISADAFPLTEGRDMYAIYTVTADIVPKSELTVRLDVSETEDFVADGDKGAKTPILTFTGRGGWRTRSTGYRIAISDDGIHEADGDVIVTLDPNTGPDYALGDGTSATVAVLDDDLREISIFPVSTGGVDEGDDAEFSIVFNTDAGAGGLTVNILSENIQGNFLDVDNVTASVVIPGGTRTVTAVIPTVADNLYERNGSVRMTVQPGTDYLVNSSAASATVNVRSDDVPVTSIHAPEFVHEGDPIRFTVRSDIEMEEDLFVRLEAISPPVDQVIDNMGAMITVEDTGYISGNVPDGVTIPAGSMSTVYEVMTTNHRGAKNGHGYFFVQIICDGDPVHTACASPSGGHLPTYMGSSPYSFEESGDALWQANDSSERYTQIREVEPPVVSVTTPADPNRIRQGAPAVFTISAGTIIPVGGLTVNIAVSEAPPGVISGAANSSVFLAYDKTGSAKTADYIVPTTSVLGEVGVDLLPGIGYTIAAPPRNAARVRHEGTTPVFSISAAQPSFVEGSDIVLILTANEPIPGIDTFSLPVSVSHSGGFVTGDLPTTVDFVVGRNTATLAIQTEDDAVAEAAGTVTVTITADTASPARYRVNGSAGDVTVRVTSDDEPVSAVGFANSSQSVYENPADPDLNRPVVILEPTSLNPVTVNYTASTGTGWAATAGADYENASGVLTFAPGERQKRINLRIIDDAALEHNETFSLTLSGPTGEAVLGSNPALSLSIVSDDGPLASVSSAQDSVPEGDTITFTVSFSSALSTTSAVSVPLVINEEGEFISSIGPPLITLPPGDTSAIFTVGTEMDAVNERNGSVMLSVPADAMNPPRWRVGESAISATVAVVSEDAPSGIPTVGLAGPDYVREGEALQLRLVSDVFVTEELAVNLNCNVTGGFMIEGCSAGIAIPAGANMVALPITVVDNNIYQTDGGNLMVAIDPSTDTPASYLRDRSSVKTAVVRDDEAPENGEFSVSFGPPGGIVPGQDFEVTYNIKNTSGALAHVALSHRIHGAPDAVVPSATWNPVGYSSSSVCRSLGDLVFQPADGLLQIGNIAFNDGETCRITVRYSTPGDMTPGLYALNNRTGDVAFPPDVTVPRRATFIQGVDTPTLTVLPHPTVRISGPDFVTEGGTHTFRVRSDYELTRKTPVNFSCNTSGDYTVTSGGDEVGNCLAQSAVSANIAFLEDFADIIVTVEDNSMEQEGGTLTMAIEQWEPHPYSTTAPAALVVPIIDNDAPPSGSPVVSLAASAYYVDEDSGTLDAEVMLSGQSTMRVVVPYSVSTEPGQTATPGVDYVAVSSGMLTFLPGETSKAITITVNDDKEGEFGETFALTLYEPYNATLGTPSSAVVEIKSSDGVFSPRLLGVSTPHDSVNEGATLTFVLTASGPLSGTETVAVGVRVSQEGDFFMPAALPTTVDFAPGATSVVLTVDTEDDATLELDGSVTVEILTDNLQTYPRWLVSGSAGSATVEVLS